MPRCCVCGKEVEYLYHGLWWCESHHPAPSRKGEENPKKRGVRKAAKE